MVIAIARPKLEGNIAVGDDRQLGFAEFGDPQGRAIFWLHGTPGARRQIPTEARVYAEENHIRLIGIDRPGIGASTPYQYDTVAAFADDLRTVADTLGIDKMAVIGLSGGGPYTLGCAAAMPDRIVAVGVLGGVAPTVGADAIGGGVMAFGSTVAPLLAVAGLPIRWAAVGSDPDDPASCRARVVPLRADIPGSRSASAGAAGIQGDVPRRSAQRRPQAAGGSLRRCHRLRPRLGIPARAGEDPGPLVARRPRPHRPVRPRAARRQPVARRGAYTCPGRAISPGSALPRKYCTPWSSSGTASKRTDFLSACQRERAHRRSAQLVHCRAAGLDDGRLRLLPRRAGLRRYREDLPPHQNRGRIPDDRHPV